MATRRLGLWLSAERSRWEVFFYRVTLSPSRRYSEFDMKVGKTNHGKVTIFDSFSFRNYSLCEITVEDGGLIKQRRLPDMLTNLPDRIHLNGRSVNSPAGNPSICTFYHDNTCTCSFTRVSYKIVVIYRICY